MNTKTTVFCAVYSQDPEREELLNQHLANLKSQSVSVEPIYIFESSDPIAQRLTGVRCFVANHPMTIYESWNLAAAMARTPFVMNLNLDDRLHGDAVETLEAALESTQSDLVGGDWKICFSQEETNQVVPLCYPATAVQFEPAWPPTPGLTVRLGSGTGQRGTYGPATLWRMSAHANCPRYPYRTADGTLIRSVGDAVWWTVLKNVLAKKLQRVPKIIGNYHSHPQDQAEFRSPDTDEWQMLQGKSICKV